MSHGEQLIKAAGQGKKELVEQLLAQGVPVDSTDEYKHTPLMDATTEGHVLIVKLLLEAKANPKAQNKFGNPILFAAARNNRLEIAQILLAAGADPNVETGFKQSPLSIAKGEVLELFNEHNAQQLALAQDSDTSL